MFRPTETDALLLIDIQVDFCPGGTLAVGEGSAVVPIANALSPRFDTVILTQDWHPPGHSSFASSHPGKAPFETTTMAYGPQTLWPDHCVQGSAGAAFHPDLIIDRAQLVIRKGFRPAIDSYSAFQENDRKTATGLAGYLRDRGIARVFLAGLATDYCVTWSAEDAVANGFQAVVLLDACRAIDLDGSLLKALERMEGAGVQLAHSQDIA